MRRFIGRDASDPSSARPLSPVPELSVDYGGGDLSDDVARMSAFTSGEGSRPFTASGSRSGRDAYSLKHDAAVLDSSIEERRRSHFVLKGELASTYAEYRDNKEIRKGGFMNRPSVLNQSGENSNTLIKSINATKNLVGNITSSVVRDVVGLAGMATAGVPSLLSYMSETNPEAADTDKTASKVASVKRDLKPIRYGDCIVLSSMVQKRLPEDTPEEDAKPAEMLRGLLSADTVIMSRASLLLFNDQSEIECMDESIFQICKPAIATTNASAADTELEEDVSAVGSILTYGSPFFLKVAKFGNCYLSIESGRPADIEKNCTRIGPSFKPTAACQFKMVPKYRNRVKDIVYYGDDLCINALGVNLFLHAADTLAAYRTPEASAFGCKMHTEVNVARIRESDSGNFLWECSQYSNFDTNTNSLFAGHFVRLYHSELRAYLSSHASKFPLFSFDDEIPEGANGKPVPLLINGEALFSFNTRNHSGGQHDFIEDLMASAVFRLEKSHVLVGGNIHFHEVVRFRHVVTGCYLSISREEAKGKKKSSSPPYKTTLARLTNPSDIESARLFYMESSFVLEPVGASVDAHFQCADCYVRIKHISDFNLRASAKELYGWINPHRPSFLSEYRAQVNLLHQQIASELKALQAQATSLGLQSEELVLTFTDDVITDIPMYPTIVDLKADVTLRGSSSTVGNDADSARRTQDLETTFSRTHRGAAFVGDANDADVIQIVPVGKGVDVKYILGGLALNRALHDFEGSLRVCAQKMIAGEHYNFPYDGLQVTGATLETIHAFCSITSDFEQIAQAFNESSFKSKRSLETEHDNSIRLARHQSLVMECGILEKLFWILRAPAYLRMKRSFVKQHRVLGKLFRIVSSLICTVCLNNEAVQEYIARSSFRGLRLGAQVAKTDSIGFLSYLFSELRTDEESASRILEAAVSSNRLLLDALFDEAVMQGVIQLIRDKGAKPSLLKLLASMANAQGQAMIHNQELLMKLLYAQTDDQRYLSNRKALLIETAIDKRSESPSRFAKDADLYLLWSGQSKSKISYSLFDDVESLGLRIGSKADADVTISEDLKNYFAEVETNEREHEWVKLESIAWYIDPPNCFKFYEKGLTSLIAWRSKKQILEQSSESVTRYNKIRQLVQYYAAVLDLYDKVTANRSCISTRCLEPQVTHNVLFSGMFQSRLPLSFRYKFGRIFKNMYVDRYPHDDLDLPNIVRNSDLVDQTSNFNSALPTYFCRSRPQMNSDGTISYSSNSTSFLESGERSKFQDVQEMMAKCFFMGENFDLGTLSSCRLGDLSIVSPLSRLGGSELDSYRFSLVLLEIMHLLLRSGFYYTEDLLLQVMHISFGVLTSHIFDENSNVDDASTSASIVETISKKPSTVSMEPQRRSTEAVSSGRYTINPALEVAQKKEVEMTSRQEEAEESEITSRRLGIHHIAKDYITSRPVIRAGTRALESIKGKISNNSLLVRKQKSMRDLDPDKSDDLIRICRRHDVAYQSKTMARDESVLVEIMEHQRYVGAWLPEVTGYRHAFSTKDPYLIAHKLNLRSPAEHRSTSRGLPDETWIWQGDWAVNPNAGGDVISEDPEGWVYSLYWPKDKRDFSPKKMPYHVVRRRLWQRTRHIKSAEQFVDGLLARKYSENAILLTIRRNLDPSGLIDMKKVLSSIRDVVAYLREKNLETQLEVEDDDGEAAVVQEQVTSISSTHMRLTLMDLSHSCLVESLGMLAYIYDIVADARITMFSAILQEAVRSNKPMWRSIESIHSNKSCLSLTPEGEHKMRSLFAQSSSGSPTDSGGAEEKDNCKNGSLYCIGGFNLGGEAFLDTVLGFVLSSNHRICDKALNVLRKHFGQLHSFSKNVGELVYSSSSETNRKFLLARHLISRAKFYVSNVKSMHGCMSSVLELEKIYSEITELMLDPVTNIVDPSAQDMLRAMRGYAPVLFVIANDVETFKTLSASMVAAGRGVRKTVYKFMEIFMYNNQKNAMLMANSMETFVEAIGLSPEIGTMSAMVIGNFSECGKAVIDSFSPHMLYKQCIAQISAYPKDLDFCSACLTVMKKTLSGDSAFISTNQADALRLLTKHRNILQLYVGTSRSLTRRKMTISDSEISDDVADVVNDFNFQERRAIILRYTTARSRGAEEAENAAYAASLLQYHADCVETLALTCTGGNIANALKCSRIIPLEVVLTVLGDSISFEFTPIITAFVTFLNLVFFTLESSTSDKSEYDIKTTDHPMILRITSVFKTMVETFESAPEDSSKRALIIRGLLPLFKALIRANADAADGNEVGSGDTASVLTQITIAISHLRTLSGFTAKEMDQINEIASMLGIPIDESMEPELSESAAVPESSRRRSAPAIIHSFSKKKETGSTTWGDADVRFSELKIVFESCPVIKDMKEGEVNTLVDYLLSSYLRMNDDAFSPGSNSGGSGDSPSALIEDNKSESAEPAQKRRRNSSKYSESESPKSPRSVADDNAKRAARDDFFQKAVARLVKFAREEVDVVISKQNFDFHASVGGRSKHEQLHRSRSDALDVDTFFFSSDDERGSSNNDLRSNRLITGNCVLSKNVEFVMRILTRCVSKVRKTHATNRLRFGEDKEVEEKNTLFEDVQGLFSQVMATSLIVEVISGCKYACVVFAALQLGIELFANGNPKCQANLVWHLKQIPSAEASNFFKSMHGTILYAASRFRSLQENRMNETSSSMSDLKRNSNQRVIEAQEETKWILAETGIDLLLEFLQLLNEGHYQDIQILMQSQDSIFAEESAGAGAESMATGIESFPLLSAAVTLLEAFIPNSYSVGFLTNMDADVIYKLFEFLTESVQGPCYVNQEVLARSAVLMLIQHLLGFVFRTGLEGRGDYETVGKFGLDYWKLKSLRVAGLRLLMSLTEGRQPSTFDPVYEALCTLDYSIVPDKLDSTLQERSIELHRLIRRGVKIEEIQAAEEIVMEEGFLFLAVSKTIAQVKPSVYADILPIVPSTVKRKQFANDIDFQQAEKQRAKAVKLMRSFYVFDDRLRSVEILWGEKGLFRFQFIMPLECSFLSEEIKEDIINVLDFGDDDRMKALVQKVHYIHDDISLKKSIDGNHYLRLLVRFQDELDYAITGMAVFINFLLVISLQQGYYTGHAEPQFEPPQFKTVVRVLTIIQVILLLYKLLQSLVLRLPIIFKDNYRFSEKLRILKRNSKSLTLRMKMRSLLKIFWKTLAVLAVSIILISFIYRRYNYVPYSLYGLCVVMVVGMFLKGLERTYRSVWTANFTGSWLVLSTASVLRDGALRFRILFALIGILSLDLSRPFFNSLMPLSVIRLSNTLQNVVKAVTLPGQALVLSAVLGFLMIFVFAIFAFFNFPTDFYNPDQGENECGTLLLCVVTFLHGGLLSGGGIADRMSSLGHDPVIADSQTYGSRVTYDVFFFVIIIVLLLNIIFGIIIDTFGKLREDASEKRRLQRNFCFVCGISRDVFEAASHDHSRENGTDGGNGEGDKGGKSGVKLDASKGSGFAEHIKNEHNLWDYVFFLIYLKMKDENNYFGIESFVADLMQRDDVSWVPRGKALRVPDTRDEEQLESEKRILDKISDMMFSNQASTERSISAQMALIQNENNVLRQQLGSTVQSVVRIQESLTALKVQHQELEEFINLKFGGR